MHTAAGTAYPYDELVVATGSDAARLPIPGAELTHVYRTLEDVRAINQAIAELTEKLGRKVNAVTIGGGCWDWNPRPAPSSSEPPRS